MRTVVWTPDWRVCEKTIVICWWSYENIDDLNECKENADIIAITSDDNDDDNDEKGWVASGRQWFGVTYDLRGRLYITTVGDVTASCCNYQNGGTGFYVNALFLRRKTEWIKVPGIDLKSQHFRIRMRNTMRIYNRNTPRRMKMRIVKRAMMRIKLGIRIPSSAKLPFVRLELLLAEGSQDDDGWEDGDYNEE